MICEKCGKELHANANFCDGCGTAVTGTPAVEAPVAAAPAPTPSTAPAPTAPVYNNFFQPQKQPISVAGWIGRTLIPAIPFVGALIYLVMLFVWAGDKTKEVSFNNWAKAQLWLLLISVILTIVVTFFVFTIMASVGSRF